MSRRHAESYVELYGPFPKFRTPQPPLPLETLRDANLKEAGSVVEAVSLLFHQIAIINNDSRWILRASPRSHRNRLEVV